MKVITDIADIDFKKPAAVALGFFDGVHLGHRAVISSAAESGLMPVVFTFAQHPRAFFGDAPELISDLNDRLSCFEQLGVEVAVAVKFADFVGMSASEFYAFLRNKLNMRAAFYGYNYRFGKGQEGGEKLLAQWCEKDGIAHTRIEPVLFNGEPISSSRIRAAMNEGDVASASQMLGRAIVLTAQVGSGKNLGRKLGFATINQPLTAPVRPLLRGVYAASVTLEGKTYPAVTNLGARPTVLQSEEAAETHIIGFDGDLYGKTVCVQFLKFLRPQRKFDNVEQLQNQIRQDVAATMEMRNVK
ncbi:MAG TPA: riboflavin biosynthesis protein RibF [Oscillospiraceae bacterium]|nr:riboflavin biosynthesis protein RibF [Oscillospiraceae bacterium]HPF56603.1 riboflavin biosynthesis protein RibF [Clostridiales bacterium]HPK35191.1 riboflavin biosynthesis protein RibF [Oscillospiraceae bacterium]HPR74994.1 riboflavin biosynthesis protein RibF [Oscillospiraceae bacterium]